MVFGGAIQRRQTKAVTRSYYTNAKCGKIKLDAMGIMKKENSVLTGVSGEGFMKEGSLWPGIDYFNKHFLVTCVCLALCWELHFKG